MGTGYAATILNATNNVWNYNLYYTNGSTLLSGSNPFAAWQAIGMDINSLVMNPGFLSTIDLRMVDGCGKFGTPLPIVSWDITGTLRNTPPTIGAFEYSSINNLAMNAVLQPVAGRVTSGIQDLIVRIKNAGSNTINYANIKYMLNNGALVSFPWSGVLDPCDTISVTIAGLNMLDKNSLTVYTDNPNGGLDSQPENDTLTIELNTPLNGIYTIGSLVTDSFASFNDAVNALKTAGVSGNVLFNVKTGTYTEQFIIPDIIGASDTSTITFTSAVNHTDSVTLIFAAVSNAPVVTLENARYINFKWLTVTSSTATGVAFKLSGTASNNSITNCKLTTGDVGINASPLPGFAGNKNVFSHNIISNTIVGISLFGVLNASVYADSNIVAYNTISAETGIRVERTQNTKIRNNTIAVNSSGYGLFSQFNKQGFEITANTITQSSTGAALLVHSARGTQEAPILIANNYLLNTFLTTSSGIGFASSNGSHLRVFHNSIIALNGRGVLSTNTTNTDSNNVWRNNIIASMGTGTSNIAAADITNTGLNNTWNNNLYYCAGPNLFAPSASAYNTWKMGGQDKHSVVYRPAFISTTNLQPNPADTACWALNGRGTHLDSTLIKTDIDGNARPLTFADGVPDIGAYEFTPACLPPLATALPDSISPLITTDTTQLFLFAGDTIAHIKWLANNNIPKLEVRQYSGVRPPGVSAPLNHMYFYITPQAAGSGP